MSNKKTNIVAPERTETEIRPALTMSSADRLVLAVHALGALSPYIYALVLRGNSTSGFALRSETVQYSFKKLDERDRYYSALVAMMRYQHTDKAVEKVLSAYAEETKDFARRMQLLEKMR